MSSYWTRYRNEIAFFPRVVNWHLSSANIADDLLNMEGMDDTLALAMAKKGIVNMENLAEQSIDELMDIENMDEEKAGKLIMEARAPWFEE